MPAGRQNAKHKLFHGPGQISFDQDVRQSPTGEDVRPIEPEPAETTYPSSLSGDFSHEPERLCSPVGLPADNPSPVGNPRAPTSRIPVHHVPVKGTLLSHSEATGMMTGGESCNPSDTSER